MRASGRRGWLWGSVETANVVGLLAKSLICDVVQLLAPAPNELILGRDRTREHIAVKVGRFGVGVGDLKRCVVIESIPKLENARGGSHGVNQ